MPNLSGRLCLERIFFALLLGLSVGCTAEMQNVQESVLKQFVPDTLPRRTPLPTPSEPDRVEIQSIGGSGGGFGGKSDWADGKWVLEDTDRVQRLYGTILNLPSAPRSARTDPNSREFQGCKIGTGEMLQAVFWQGQVKVDEFWLEVDGCNYVWIGARGMYERDVRMTRADFWVDLARLLNVRLGSRRATADAQWATAARETAIIELTRTPTIAPRALTRQANRTQTAQAVATPSP